MIAVDLCLPMLEYARRKAGPDTQIAFLQEDMRSFTLEVGFAVRVCSPLSSLQCLFN